MQLPADRNAVLRRLPKVDEVLASPAVRGLLERAPRWAVVTAVRGEIERLRAEIVAERSTAVDVDAGNVANEVAELMRPSLQPVINATGVVLHTNLGRAPLAEHAVARVAAVARGYTNLEYRLDARRRGSRHEHVAGLIAALTGAEDALVVNNCAAAVLLALSQLAAGRDVVVSRGELVEIGGSFRVPDIMRASGARLVEVGTTNRTHLGDYEDALTALGSDTALLLKVHRSNFAVVGFTAEVEVRELAELAHGRDLPAMVDLGSGALADLRALGLGGPDRSEPTVPRSSPPAPTSSPSPATSCSAARRRASSSAAAPLVAAMRAHPLLRAVRPDKLTLAALEATLELYRDGRSSEIPTIAMLATPEPTLEARARQLSAACQAAAPALEFSPVRVRSAVGGGALPTVEPWSWAVAATARDAGGPSADALDARLRRATPPVVARIAEDRLLLDVRTLADDDLPAVARAFAGDARWQTETIS